jgi:TorA-specific chaperone
MSESQMLIDVLKGRAVMYELLASGLLGPPDEAFLHKCSEVKEKLGEMCRGTGNPDAQRGYEQWSAALAALPENPADALLELNRQYTSMFTIGGDAVSPYESVHRSVEGLMKQEPWEEVCNFYAKRGLGVASSSREMEDHAAIELAFMNQLTLRALDALESDPEAFETAMASQKDFMEEHLSVWLPEVMAAVVARAPDKRAAFLGGFAGMARGFLAVDRELLASWQ